jgi:hypothetical protein
VLIVAGSAALLALGASQVREWAVMTDELLYAKLATATGSTGSPLPVLHGDHVGFIGVVYPILLSPFYGSLDTPAAFTAAHMVNAILFASAAIPAYLLALRLLLPAGWSFAFSFLTVAVPWAVLAGFVMSESTAYPVFLWAVLAVHVALTKPSPWRDGLAAGALVLAFVTRPQFLFLVVVLPIAAILAEGPRRALARHRLLGALYAFGLVVVVPLAAFGQAHRLLGDYGVTATQGSLLPAGVWKSAALHLDVLAVGLGAIPFILGAGWSVSRLRAEPRARAVAAITMISLLLLALETASYDLRFGGDGVIRDRYVFYLAPLLLLASAACLREPRLPILGIAGATAFFAGTVALADFKPVAGLWVDSPTSVLNGMIRSESSGLSPGVFVAICGVLLGVICLALAWLPRSVAAAMVAIAVFGFTGSTAGYAFERLLTSRTPSGLPVTGQSRVRDWIDRAAAGSVALIAYPVSRDWGQSAVVWWEAEFWNRSIDRAFVVPGGTFTYTPFPTSVLRLDFGSGRLPGTAGAPPYVLRSPSDSRFGLAGSQAATNAGLVLYVADRPYRAIWATRGLDSDGWTRPGRLTTIRIYAQPGSRSQRVDVAVTLDSPPEAQTDVLYRLSATSGSIASGTRVVAHAVTCVPQGSHADLALRAGRAATIAGPPVGPTPGPQREVGPVVSGIELTQGTRCHP